MPASPGVLEFDTFFGIALRELMCIFALEPSSSPSLFPDCISIWLFCYVLFVSLFCLRIVLLACHPVIGMSSCILLLIVGRIFFRCFGMTSFFCIVWFCLGIFFSLPSFAIIFWLVSSTFFEFYLQLLLSPLEFFISTSADSLLLEFEWQQVSSSLQDSSQYSGRSQ